MQLSDTDRALITQSAALAAAHEAQQMRDYLASTGSPFATSTEYIMLAAACLGNAQANLNSLIALIEQLTGERASA